MDYHTFDTRTVYVSCSRDMAAGVRIVRSVVDEINRDLPAGERIAVHHWADADLAWDAGVTWQSHIARTSDPRCIAVVSLFGERIGEPLPASFPLPDDLTLPLWLAPPNEATADRVPVTGTMFEFADALHGPHRPPVMAIFKAEPRAIESDGIDPLDRDYGFSHEFARICAGRRRPPAADAAAYDAQILALDRFVEAHVRQGKTAFLTFGSEAARIGWEDEVDQAFEELRVLLRRELPKRLGIHPTSEGKRKAKGLMSYGPEDHDILFGRDRAIYRALTELRDNVTRGTPPVMLLTGRSGEGKSSVLRAGLVGRLGAGQYADGFGPFVSAEAPVLALVDEEPSSTLAGMIESALGATLWPDHTIEDFAPAARVDKLREALKRVLAGRPRVGTLRTRVFLGLDQLDEALLAAEDDEAMAIRLRAVFQTIEVLASDGHIWCVATIPSDQVDRARALLDRPALASQTLHPIGEDDVREIAERSFRSFGLPSGLIAPIVDQAAAWLRREDPGPVLPLLSALMAEMPGKLKAAQMASLRLGADDEPPSMPTLVSVLDDLGERAIESLAKGNDWFLNEDLGRILGQLVRTARIDGSPTAVQRNALEDHAAFTGAPELTDALARARFIYRTARGRWRLTHLAILEGWSRAKDWYEKDRMHQETLNEIEPRAERWCSDHEDEPLLTGRDLARAGALWASRWQDPDGLPTAFIRASLESAIDRTDEDWCRLPDGGSVMRIAIATDDDALRERALARVKASNDAEFILKATDPEKGRVVSHLTVIARNAEALKAVLAAGAPAEALDTEGWTPLTIASFLGRHDLAQILLNASASVDAASNDGWTSLHLASHYGHEALARFLLSEGAAADAATNDGRTPLHQASWNGHETAARVLLAEGAAVHAATDRGAAALHLASERGHEAVVRLLLSEGAAVDAAANDGRTSLHLASQNGHEAVVRLLLSEGVAVDTATNDGVTSLHLASLRGHEAVARLLLSEGAAVDAAANDDGTSLHLASQNGHEAVARLLLSEGAAVDAAKNDGGTSLHLASHTGYEAVVRLLLSEHAAVDAAANDGVTPLHGASHTGHEAVARLLLSWGAAVNAAANDGGRSLHWASQNGHEAVSRLLLSEGAAVDAATNNGVTPLHGACESGQEAVSRLLLSEGAAVDAAMNDGRTSLHLASLNGHEAVARLLLSEGAAFDAAANDGGTSLHLASLKGHEALVRLLLSEGAAVDASGNNGATALHVACERSYEAVARLLLSEGAAVDAAANEGVTSLHLASMNGHEAVARLLLSEGAAVDAAVNKGATALHIVTEGGHEALALLLAERGADPNLEFEGVSPLAIAVAFRRSRLAAAFIAAGGDIARAEAGALVYLGDPELSLNGIVEAGALTLDKAGYESLKERMRDAAPKDFDAWCAALARETEALGGDAAAEVARMRALAV